MDRTISVDQATINMLPTTYMVGHLRIAPNITLAPMAGVTDTIFRRLVLGFGHCGLVCTEMTNAASLSPKALKSHGLLRYLPQERPLAMQISGNDPAMMSRAAATVESLGADILDINCGCPSPKVTGGGHGASLLRDLPKLEQVLRAVRGATSLPLSLKFRAGWDEEQLNFIETAKIAEDTGISALVLHPRTREQRYRGVADWERVARVKEAVGIPVIGSGDVTNAMAALVRLARYGVDGVMIGRGAIANPWIFLQIGQIRRGEAMFEPLPVDKYNLLCDYLTLCQAELPDRVALNKLKQLIDHLFLGLPGSAALRTTIQRSTSVIEARHWLDIFFAPYRTMSIHEQCA